MIGHQQGTQHPFALWVTKHTALAQPKEQMQSPYGNTKGKLGVHALLQKYKIYVGTSPGLWHCPSALLRIPPHTGWSQDALGGQRGQGHVSCYSLQPGQPRCSTGRQPRGPRSRWRGERRQDSGLSTTGSVRRTDRVGSTESSPCTAGRL